MKIILATKNKGKIKDFEKLTDKMDIEVLSILDDIDFPDVVEDGKTFEENSAKKGFDGLVLEGEKFWLLESKSSQIGHNNSHRNTVYRAYKGLEKQLSGENEKINNPWRNAYNHTKIAQSPNSLVKRVAELSTNYTNGDYFKIEDNNVIIGSTIIPDKRGNHHINEINFEVSTLNNFIKNHKSKDEIIIAINLQTIEIFLEYLEEIIDE